MSVTTSKLSDNMDLLGALAGFFIMVIIWTFMINWDSSRNEILSNNQEFQLMVGIFVLIPLFFYGFIILVRGLFNLIWELAASRAE